MTLLLIVWLLCGISAAFIAYTKDRSVGGFFVAGALLGVFGLAWVLLARPGADIERNRMSSRNW